jgi:hypothetical protein
LKVTVKNAKGEVLALGNLGDARSVIAEGYSYSWCTFPFTLSVPASDFYTVSVGKLEQSFQTGEVREGKVSLYTDSEGVKSLITY